MSIPKYNEFYTPILEYISDGSIYSGAELEEYLANKFSISNEERQERLAGGALTFCNRIGWAKTYLKKAGLIVAPKRGYVQITESGKLALQSNAPIDNNYLSSFSSFQEFKNREQRDDIMSSQSEQENDSPQDKLDSAYRYIRQTLAEELLAEIMNKSSMFFEHLVVKLLTVMGYGGSFSDAGIVTRASGDEGIDGIIKQDKLGFDQIYIQAKRWDLKSSVGRPEIQKFVGALAGQGASRGLFVTTASFSEEAKNYARRQHTTKIVLIDGQALAELMIDHNLGVSPIETYEIKRIDSDFFNDAE